MLYKPINPSPHMTSVDVSDNVNFHLEIPKHKIGGYCLRAYDLETGNTISTTAYDSSENQKYQELGEEFNIIDKDISSGDIFENGKNYSWNCLYWKRPNEYTNNNIVFFNAVEKTNGTVPHISEQISGIDKRYLIANANLFTPNGNNKFYSAAFLRITNEATRSDGTLEENLCIAYDKRYYDTAWLKEGNILKLNFVEEKKSFILKIKSLATSFHIDKHYGVSDWVSGIDEANLSDIYKFTYYPCFDSEKFEEYVESTRPTYERHTSGVPHPEKFGNITVELVQSTADLGNIILSPIYSVIESFRDLTEDDKKALGINFDTENYVLITLKDMITETYLYQKLSTAQIISTETQTSPDYYFSARSSPSFSPVIKNENYSNGIVDDFVLNLDINYSQSDNIGLNCVCYSLYAGSGLQRKIIHESPVIVQQMDGSFEYSYKGLLPDTKYTIEAWGMDDDGVNLQSSLGFSTIQCEYSDCICPVLRPCSSAADIFIDTANQTDNIYDETITLYKQKTNCSYTECLGDISIIKNGKLVYDTISDYNLCNHQKYKYFAKTKIYTTDKSLDAGNKYVDNLNDNGTLEKMIFEKIKAVDDSGNSVIVEEGIDYYVHLIQPDDSGNSFELLTTDVGSVLMASVPIDGSVDYCCIRTTTSPNLVYSEQTIVSDEIEIKFNDTSILGVSLDNEVGVINDEFVSIGGFSSDLSEIKINLQNNYVSGFSKYEKEQKGYTSNINSDVTILLPSYKTQKDWIDFIERDDIKLLKDFNGQTVIIGIESSSIRPYHFPGEGLTNEITISYKEIGRAEDIPIYTCSRGL